MSLTRSLWLFHLPAALAAAILAAPAGATGFGLEVLSNGASLGSYDQAQLGCTAYQAGKAQCSGGGVVLKDSSGNDSLRLDSWNLHIEGDPVVSGPISVTNLFGVTQQFTFIFTLPVAPIGPSSLTGGSVQGGMTDNNGDGVTLSAPTGSAFYTPRIDGVSFAPGILYANPASVTQPAAFQSGNVPSLAFGTPIPSLAGPAVASSIGIQLDFNLTAQDSASFTSVFVVQPVPEPATAALFGLGLLALGIRARRRS